MYIFISIFLISLLTTLSSIALGKGLMYLMAYTYLKRKDNKHE